MALRYPFLIIVGLLFIIFCIFFKKKKLPYKKGVKVANTIFIKNILTIKINYYLFPKYYVLLQYLYLLFY